MKLFEHFGLNDVVGKQIKDKRGGERNIHSWDFGLKGEVSSEQKTLLSFLVYHQTNLNKTNTIDTLTNTSIYSIIYMR